MKSRPFPVLLAATAALLAAQTDAIAMTQFSIDLGSDKEVSDPLGGAGELLDPGDVYERSAVAGSTALPWFDDVALFGGTDPRPVQGVLASACTAGSMVFPNCFDMDGLDALDRRVSNLDLGEGYIYADQFGPTECVYRAQYLSISMDDDGPEGMEEPVAPRAPTEGGPDRGSAAGNDELFGVTLGGGAVVWVPMADETSVHIDLAPNPAPTAEDDDVDALDMAKDPCNVIYFSADDEARLAGPLGLNPGTIYEHVPGMAGAPVAVVTFAELGTTQATDIDAFEFAWVRIPGTQTSAFALIFSVDEDRPSTAVDESGGLNPGAIYASFLNGGNFVYAPSQALPAGDIDAIAATDQDLTLIQDTDGDAVADALDNCILVPNPNQFDANGDGIGNRCDPDFTDNCLTDFSDLLLFRANFFGNDPVYDLDEDGSVGFSDLVVIRSYFLMPPGPSAFACP